MRVISPAEYVFGATVALGVFFLLLITAIGLVAEAFPGLRKTSEPFDWSMYRWVPLALPQVAGIAYGSLRAAYFHPLRREAYLRWLRTTPWAPPRPLPLGPATLCGQDAVWLAVFAALVGPSGFPLAILGPVVLGLAAYAFVSVRTLRAAGPYWAAYASMFASVALVFVAFRGGTLAFLRYLQELAELESVRSVAVTLMLHGAMAAALFVVIVVVTQIGLRQQLRRVPWDAEALPPTVRRQRGATLAQHWQKVHRLGWPLCELNPQRDDTSRYGPFERMAATLLLGWIAALIAATARLITPEALDSLAEDPNKARHDSPSAARNIALPATCWGGSNPAAGSFGATIGCSRFRCSRCCWPRSASASASARWVVVCSRSCSRRPLPCWPSSARRRRRPSGSPGSIGSPSHRVSIRSRPPARRGPTFGVEGPSPAPKLAPGRWR
jgi:hypothetical protein